MRPRQILSFGIICIIVGLFLAACQEPAAETVDIPTLVVAIELPTDPPPTATHDLPPTSDLSTPTQAPTPTVVRAATVTPTFVPSAVNITSPSTNTQLFVGTDLVVSGLVNVNQIETVSVVLLAASGFTLLETPATVGSNNGWTTTIRIPESVTGPAQLIAVVRDGTGTVIAQDAVDVQLVVDTSTADRYLTLFRPTTGEVVVGGYYIFFDGIAQRPVGGRVTLQILADDCQTPIATQAIVLDGSGYWQGYVYVPRDIVGAACAYAVFGSPGDPNWRAVQMPIEILDREAEGSIGLRLHSPTDGSELVAGQTISLYGLAYNARDDLVIVNLQREDGQVISQATGSVGEFGYWETVIILPFGSEGVAELSVLMGDAARGDFAEQKIVVTILPAPTPTPGP